MPGDNVVQDVSSANVQGRAGADHTTLLLNCYTKLKDVAKLDAFLRGSGATEGASSLPFDVETAVKVIASTSCPPLSQILFTLPPSSGLYLESLYLDAATSTLHAAKLDREIVWHGIAASA